MVDFDKVWASLVIYYEQIKNCEVADGPLADYSGTIVDNSRLGALKDCLDRKVEKQI